MMNPVWFMLLTAIPNPSSNNDTGETVMINQIYPSYQACVDSIDKIIESRPREPEIEDVGVICVQGFVKPLKKGDPA